MGMQVPDAVETAEFWTEKVQPVPGLNRWLPARFPGNTPALIENIT